MEMKRLGNRGKDFKMQANFNFCHFVLGGSQQHPLDIYAVPNMPSNLLGEVVSATIGGAGIDNENVGNNIVPLGGVGWPYEGSVPSDFHLDDTPWDSK